MTDRHGCTVLAAACAAGALLAGCGFYPDILDSTTPPILTGEQARKVCLGTDPSFRYDWQGLATNVGTRDDPEWECTSYLNFEDLSPDLPVFEFEHFEGFERD